MTGQELGLQEKEKLELEGEQVEIYIYLLMLNHMNFLKDQM